EALGLEINPLRSGQRQWEGCALIIQRADKKGKKDRIPELTGDGDENGESPNYEIGDEAGMRIA
ncbi:hypothetical protein Tco_0574068, partial [Tanacetum coccineum]